MWGYHVYVLDPRFQYGIQIPKWQPKTRQGQYVGKPPTHASSVGLIRNLQTGYIFPYFHVMYDTSFQTVMCGCDTNDPSSNHIWEFVVNEYRSNAVEQTKIEQENIPRLHTDWMTTEEQFYRNNETINNKVT